jgi:hypothetical protein
MELKVSSYESILMESDSAPGFYGLNGRRRTQDFPDFGKKLADSSLMNIEALGEFAFELHKFSGELSRS